MDKTYKKLVLSTVFIVFCAFVLSVPICGTCTSNSTISTRFTEKWRLSLKDDQSIYVDFIPSNKGIYVSTHLKKGSNYSIYSIDVHTGDATHLGIIKIDSLKLSYIYDDFLLANTSSNDNVGLGMDIRCYNMDTFDLIWEHSGGTNDSFEFPFVQDNKIYVDFMEGPKVYDIPTGEESLVFDFKSSRFLVSDEYVVYSSDNYEPTFGCYNIKGEKQWSNDDEEGAYVLLNMNGTRVFYCYHEPEGKNIVCFDI